MALSDILPVIPYAGLLLIGRRARRAADRRPAGRRSVRLLDGLLLSRPYLASISNSLYRWR